MNDVGIFGREIDLSSSAVIGSGQCSQVYAYGDDFAVKLFFDTIPEEEIRKEYHNTLVLCQNGLAAVKVYEYVNHHGRIGILMQRLKGMSVERAILQQPDKLGFFAVKMARNLAAIHQKDVRDAGLSASSDFYLACIDNCLKDRWISEAESRKLREMVRAVPNKDNLIHGDYHILNMMIEQDEIRMIDLADVRTGHPIYPAPEITDCSL